MCKAVTIVSDPRIRTTVSDDVMAMEGGLQPFLFCSSRGTLVFQAQLPLPPYRTKNKMVYNSLVGTCVSRDYGRSWERFIHRPNEDEVNIEGGVVELHDGTIMMLDTYVIPSDEEGTGTGELWRSSDDWNTLQGPYNVRFEIPDINFDASSDDGGHPHRAARLHRSIIETPNGDLFTTIYTWFKNDTAPSAYMPSMKKTRAILLKSSDGGETWKYVSTIAADTGVGTEGFTEPVLVRVSKGKKEGRLICMMRTGRELYEAHSDDEGMTWSRYRPVEFKGIDIYNSSEFERMFKGKLAGQPPEYQFMIGAEVDPDLIEMQNGVLVCAFGVRIPEKACWIDPGHRMNGNYLAFSLDQGLTWSHIVQITSGIMTTHYMGIREMKKDQLYVVYDVGAWGKPGRAVRGCRVNVELL